MKNKLVASVVAAVIVVGAGSFYGGMKYAQSQPRNGGQGQQFGMRAGATGSARGARVGGGVVAGEVLALDDKTVTLKLRDGGSRIVFLGESTTVGKTVAGNRSDIAVGEEVTAIGTPNDDGSMTAQSVQIRPAITAVSVK